MHTLLRPQHTRAPIDAHAAAPTKSSGSQRCTCIHTHNTYSLTLSLKAAALAEAASRHAAELAEVRSAMRDEAAAEVTKVKVEQRRLEALTAGDLKQLHELHEERVAHLERMVSKPANRAD